MTVAVHTIPVPECMTPEDAWMEIAVMGRFVERHRIGGWVNVVVAEDGSWYVAGPETEPPGGGV